MKVSEADPRVVLSADLILPYAGEAAGSAVREHDFEKLNNSYVFITNNNKNCRMGRFNARYIGVNTLNIPRIINA